MIQLIAKRDKIFTYFSKEERKYANVWQLFRDMGAVLDKIPESERHDLFFTAFHSRGVHDADVPQLAATTFDQQELVLFKLAGATGLRSFYYGAFCEFFGIGLKSLGIIEAVKDIYVFIFLTKPIVNTLYFTENSTAYEEICARFNRLLTEKSLSGRADSAIFQPTVLVPLPGSKIIVDGREKGMATLEQTANDQINFNIQEFSKISIYLENSISKFDLIRKYPNPDLKEIFHKCSFVKETAEDSTKADRDMVEDFISILSSCQKDECVIVDGQKRDKKSLSKKVMNQSESYGEVSPEEFDKAFEREYEFSSRFGARKCQAISKYWNKCQDCDFYQKINSPIELRSRDHIASKETGYWKMGKNGPVEPYYQDLAAVMKKTYHIKTTTDERVFFYRDGFYQVETSSAIKTRLQDIMYPADPIRDRHRNEFVSSIKFNTMISKEEEETFLNKTIKDKINFNNCVVDLKTLEKLDHDPKFGFLTKIPYDYVENEESQYFFDWLKSASVNKSDVYETVLDVLAYCLFPLYTCHKVIFLLGGGQNGKSTLLDIITNLVGENNTSNVSLNQLVCNSFARQLLDGKMVNVAAENTGVILTKTENDKLKEFSGDDRTFVEQKGERGYFFRNKAKLIFSANDPPVIKEDSQAMRRRLVTIPFYNRIEKMDPGVGRRLREETGKIASHLVRRVHKNILQNGGDFMFVGDGENVKEATHKMLYSQNYAVKFYDEMLTQSDAKSFVPVDDMYRAFQNWCKDSGIERPIPRHLFTKILNEAIFTNDEQYGFARVNGQAKRVFFGIKFINGPIYTSWGQMNE